ncbi:MAG: hypothetical protein HQM16_09620 [Deltaproteobacteria bacterium]|nr:hypothetical protein [Deltaproteobacteria bacterium]
MDNDGMIDKVSLKSLIDHRDPLEHLRQLADHVARADRRYGPSHDLQALRDGFYHLMLHNFFLPEAAILCHNFQSDALMGGHVALRPTDDFDNLFLTLKQVSIYLQNNIDVAVDFSDLRASRARVGTGDRQSLGPEKLMELYEKAPRHDDQSSVICFYLNIDHLDISRCLAFIRESPNQNRLMIGVSREFVWALCNGAQYGLRHKRQQEPSQFIRADDVFNKIVDLLCLGKEISFFFEDWIDAFVYNHRFSIRPVVNLQGQLVDSHEITASGCLNLLSFARDNHLDEEALSQTIRTAVHFLDNCIEIRPYPDQITSEKSRRTRRVGLSVLGLSAALEAINPEGGEKKEQRCLKYIIDFINTQAIKASYELGEQRGIMQKIWYNGRWHPARHSQLITQIHQAEWARVSKTPLYFLSDNLSGDASDKNGARHSLWQNDSHNIASYKMVMTHMGYGPLKDALIRAHSNHCLSLEPQIKAESAREAVVRIA